MANSSGLRKLNMFNRGSQPITTESTVESTNSVVKPADSTADSSPDLARIGVRVWALNVKQGVCLRAKLETYSSTSKNPSIEL